MVIDNNMVNILALYVISNTLLYSTQQSVIFLNPATLGEQNTKIIGIHTIVDYGACIKTTNL